MSRIYCGKGVWENKVRISFNNHKNSLIYIFSNIEEANKFYEHFDFTGKKLGMIEYLKFKICKHESMYDLDCNSDRYYYKYCPDCNKAEYINTETFEQKVERFDKLNKRIKRDRINELGIDIETKQQKLDKLTKEYIEEFGEEF